MISRLIYLSAFLTLTSACSNPEYVVAGELPAVSEEEAKASCPYVLAKLDICLTAQWETTPDSTQYNSMIVNLPEGDITQFEELTALLWMPSMGHGSAPVKIEKLSDRSYRIYDMFFVMKGDWEVRIVLKSGAETIDQVFIPVLL